MGSTQVVYPRGRMLASALQRTRHSITGSTKAAEISMHEERLLERIRSMEREPLRRGGDNQRRCIDSVLTHLQRILNTRQGNVPIAGDYGVPDFQDFLQTYPDSVIEIERNIRNAIDKYEPRLSGTTVTYIPDEEDGLTLRFQIIACLTVEGGRKVFFKTVVDTDGRIRIHK